MQATSQYTLWGVAAGQTEPVNLATGSRAYVNAERRALQASAEVTGGAMPYPHRTFTITRKGYHPGRAWIPATTSPDPVDTPHPMP